MPIFDAATPGDATKAGLIAKVVREDIKAVLNAKLEGVVVQELGAVWECFEGWPRVYVAGAAPAPPAGADEGRCWLDTTDDTYWVHDGTDWNRVGPTAVRTVIPLFFGLPQDFNTAGAWNEKDSLYIQAATGNFLAEPWHATEGVRFNNASVPPGAAIHFGAVASSLGAASLEVRLYDETASIQINNTDLTFIQGDVEDLQSVDVTADLVAPPAEHRYRIQVKSTGGLCVLFGAELRVLRA